MTLPRLAAVAVSLASLALVAPAAASDHLDSPASGKDFSTDLTDFFAFTPPAKDRLVLILNVHPQASAASKFSDKAVYSFRLRPVAKDDAREIRVDCDFDAATVQAVSCTAYAFDSRTSRISATAKSAPGEMGRIAPVSDFKNHGMRVFAGLRSDPFFLDVGLGASFKKGEWAFVGKNSVNGLNALSLVVELDVAKLMPRIPVLRAAAEITKKKAVSQ